MNGHIEIVKILLPVSNTNKYVKNWIKKFCENQEVKDLILNFKRKV
jgi:hypothetical protein